MIAADAEALLDQGNRMADIGGHDMLLELFQLDARGAELGMHPLHILPTIVRSDQTILLETRLR